MCCRVGISLYIDQKGTSCSDQNTEMRRSPVLLEAWKRNDVAVSYTKLKQYFGKIDHEERKTMLKDDGTSLRTTYISDSFGVRWQYIYRVAIPRYRAGTLDGSSSITYQELPDSHGR